MDDRAIVDCIRGLAAEDRQLREQQRMHGPLTPAEAVRLAEVGAGLEHMWHLLRQRRDLGQRLRSDPGHDRLSA